MVQTKQPTLRSTNLFNIIVLQRYNKIAPVHNQKVCALTLKKSTSKKRKKRTVQNIAVDCEIKELKSEKH